MKDSTREKVTGALLYYISQKEYEKITVTDITKKAGISRMSFYRNYRNIDEILFEVIDSTLNEFHKNLDEFRYMDLDSFTKQYFESFKKIGKLIEAAKKSGCYERLFTIILKYNRLIMEKYLGRKELTDEELLLLHYHSGGMYEIIKIYTDTDFNISLENLLEVLKKCCPFRE